MTETLDNLLNEFEGKPKPAIAPQTDVAKLVEEFRPVVSFAKAAMEKETKAQIDKDIEEAVTFLTSAEETKGMPKKLVRGFLTDWYNGDPETQDAWKNKAKAPEAFTKALEKARSAFVGEVAGMPQSKLRTDVEAAKAAVSGHRAPTEKKEGASLTPEQAQSMSDSEWRKLMQSSLKAK